MLTLMVAVFYVRMSGVVCLRKGNRDKDRQEAEKLSREREEVERRKEESQGRAEELGKIMEETGARYYSARTEHGKFE